MYGYVYLTVDTIRNNVYVGQHKSEMYDTNYFGSGNIIRRILKKRPETLKNYVLEWCEDKETLNNAEIEWITLFRIECNSLNIANGGQGGAIVEMTEERKDKIRKRKIEWNKNHQGYYNGENNPMYGKTGKQNPMYGVHRYGEESPHYGKHHTDETKQKMSDVKKNMYSGEKNPFYGKHHKKIKFLTPDGRIVEMVRWMAHMHHPDWIEIEETEILNIA